MKKFEALKIKLEEYRVQAHLRNPIRIHNEKKHNSKIDAAIAANGGHMPEEIWNQTFFAAILRNPEDPYTWL